MSPQRSVGEQGLRGPRCHGNSHSFLKEVGGTLTHFVQGGSPPHLSREGGGGGGHSTHVFPSPNFFGCFSKLESSSPCHIFSVQGEPHFYINCVLRPENFEFLESLHKTTKAKGL